MNRRDQRSGAETTVVLIGTLDTKGAELGFLRDRLRATGVRTLLVDVGILAPPTIEPDVDRGEVAAATGLKIATAVREQERGEVVAAMADAAAATVRRLHAEGRCDGILAAGGGTNTAIALTAMRALPFGLPKLIVSTQAGGASAGFLDLGDVVMVPSIADVAGLNSILVPILINAAGAMAGMVGTRRPDLVVPAFSGRRIATSMFGVTTPCVTAARELLEAEGHEVITFHATGAGGREMERLLRDGFFAGVLDVTTTELADELVGGALTAGPERLTAAGAAGLPQVVSVGALDMVNFGAPETVPEYFRGRTLSAHTPTATLMRTTPEDCARIGADLARKLSAASGPTAVFVPLRGLSALSGEGEAFYDPEADRALFDALREGLSDEVELHELDLHINDREFGEAMAKRLADYLRKDHE